MGGGVQIGVYVSMLNRCDYCVEHHFAGLRRLLDDDDRGDAIRASLENDQPDAFDPRQFAMLAYARRLTLEPSEVTPDDLHRLRAAGLDDGEILEVNQVAAYFAYARRRTAPPPAGWGLRLPCFTLSHARKRPVTAISSRSSRTPR